MVMGTWTVMGVAVFIMSLGLPSPRISQLNVHETSIFLRFALFCNFTLPSCNSAACRCTSTGMVYTLRGHE